MRLLMIAVAALALTGCANTGCKSGTLLLHVTLEGGAESATQLAVTIQIGTQIKSASATHTPGGTSADVVVDFAGSYPMGMNSMVTVTALDNGGPIASATIRVGFPANCAESSITVDASGHGADLNVGSDDLASPPDDLMSSSQD